MVVNVTLALVYTTKVSLILTPQDQKGSQRQNKSIKNPFGDVFPTFPSSFLTVALEMSTLTLVYS